MTEHKKIILAGNTAWSMYNFRMGVAKALRASGWEVIIVAPFDHTSPLIRSEGFEHLDIAMDNKGMSPIRDLQLLRAYYQLYKKIRPLVVIHYTIKPNIYGGIAARLSGIKCISFVTGLGSAFIKRNLVTQLVEQMYRLSFSHSTRVWFLNDQDFGHFVGQGIVRRSKAEVFPGEGINTDYFRPGADEDDDEEPEEISFPFFKFLYLGRILRDKGVVELVEACKMLRAKYPQIRIQLLGYIDALNPTAITQPEVCAWVKEGLVRDLGPSLDVRPFISNAHCIVLPSYREGISRTLLEAASMERPIIATDVPGCREIVDDNITGFLCRVKDPKDLSLKMEAVMNMSVEARQKMGELGRLKVLKEFDEQIIIHKYLSTLRQIV